MPRTPQNRAAPIARRVLAVAALLLVLVLGFGGAALVAPPAVAEAQPGETTTPAAGTTTQTTTQTTTAEGPGGRHSARWITALVVLIGGLVVAPFLADFFIAHRWRRTLLDAIKSNDFRAAELRVLSQQPRGTHGLTRALLAFSVVTMFSLTLLYVLVERPSDQNQLVSNLVSILGTLAAAVIAFYFGTRAAEGVAETRGGDDGEDDERRRGSGGERSASSTNTVAPSISGTARVDALLTASPGTWTGTPTLTYTWERCDEGGVCAAIPDATADSYTPDASDVGKTIRVIVAAGSQSAASPPVGPVVEI